MANETTSTSANDIVYSAVIAPVVMAVMAEQNLPMAWCREFDIRSQASNAIDVAIPDSDIGSGDDDGASVDGEFDATEGTGLANTEWSTGKATLTCAEYGIAYEVTDTLEEDHVSGLNLFSIITSHMARALGLAWSKDFVDLASSLSNSVGTTTADLTIAQMLSAQTGIRTRGGLADDGLVYLLDNEQVLNLEGALIATSTSAASYAAATDRLLGVSAGPNNGMGAGRQVMGFRGYPVVASGLCPTANAAADVVGMCLTPAGPNNNDYATFGNAIKRLPRFESERSAKGRSTDLVLTMRMGPGELVDGSGTKIVTDAP